MDYVRRKYGDDHVAQIVTFGTMAARGVIRDVGRVLNMPYADVDVIAKLVPNTLHITLNDALRLSKQLSDLYEADEQVKAYRHRQSAGGDAPPRLHPRCRRGHHPEAGVRICAPGEK